MGFGPGFGFGLLGVPLILSYVAVVDGVAFRQSQT